MNSVINLTVPSGFQHSNIADLPNFNGFCTVVANALTSCQLFLQKEHRIFLSFLAVTC